MRLLKTIIAVGIDGDAKSTHPSATNVNVAATDAPCQYAPRARNGKRGTTNSPQADVEAIEVDDVNAGTGHQASDVLQVRGVGRVARRVG